MNKPNLIHPKISIQKEPESVCDIMARWLKKQNFGGEQKRYVAFQSWEQISDECLKKHTRPFRFTGRSLEILVDSAPFCFELKNFRKRELLEKLKTVSGDLEISEISFICQRVCKS